MNRRRNIIIILVVLVAVIALGAFAARPKNDALTARVVKVAYTRYQTKLPETGVVQRPRTQTLAALVGGNVEHIYVHPGQRVSAGQLLATISNPQLINSMQTAHDAYVAAIARARTVSSTNGALPAQNRSAIVQAEAAVENARFTLNQSVQDERAGAQSGLGYGGQSAAAQRASAEATVATAQTDLREAQRIADANRDLFSQKAISRDALDQSLAKLAQTKVAYQQAQRQLSEVNASLARQTPVLSDRVRANRDALNQAQAQLAAARANAAQDKSGDVQAASADAAQRYDDWQYAAAQVNRMRIVAPFSGIVQTVANQTADTLRTLQPGDPLTLGQAVIVLAADGAFIVRARVDEQDVANIRPAQPAIVSGEDLGTTKLPGHVAMIGAVAQKSDDPSNTARQVITTIALDRTVPFLRDGMTVDVDIVTVDMPHALAVPGDAVRRDAADKPFVLVVRDGKAVKRSVTLGPANDAQAIVKSGVKPGEIIIAERNVGIVDGLRVKPTTAPTTAPSAKP